VPKIQKLAVPGKAWETSDMLDADLQRLRDDNTAIADLLTELEKHLALPLPPEPPFQVMAGHRQVNPRVIARRA
jgi:hypothetical protein